MQVDSSTIDDPTPTPIASPLCPPPPPTQEQFVCPYCKGGNHTVQAPLASTFPPHKGLRCHLSEQEDLPMCQDCPEEHPSPVTVHCADCNSNRLHSAIRAIPASALLDVQHSSIVVYTYPSPESLKRHRRQTGHSWALPASPNRGGRHHGHPATSVGHSTTLLGQQLGTLLEGLVAPCRDIASAAGEWKGQAAVAEFLSETQCALLEAQGEKTKMLEDSATALACRQMRDSVARLKEEQLSALGQLSVASAETAVLAGKAKTALQTERPGDLVACLSAVRLGTGTVLQSKQPAMSIVLQQHAVPTGSLIVPRCVHLGCSDSPNTQAII
eukprot:gene12941-biopygen5987